MELLTIPETAALLRVSPVTIRRFIAAGELPAVRVGRAVRIEKAAAEGLAKPVKHGATSVVTGHRRRRRPDRCDNTWLLGLIGLANDPDDGVHDVSSNKYKYLIEEYSKGLSGPAER